MMLVCFLYSVPKKLKASSAGRHLYEKFGVIRESGRTALCRLRFSIVRLAAHVSNG